MISIRNLQKSYGGSQKKKEVVLKGITLDLPDRGLVCILGESGCGKTTLLNSIGGLDRFDSGEIDFDGNVVRDYRIKQIEKIRNDKFGYIFQNYYLLMNQTVEYNVMLALNVFDLTQEEKEERVTYVLESLGMERYKKKLVSNLSGGQRQRVSIARALVKAPAIILADEPTGNLDEENTIKIMSILKSISKQCLVLLVSHERRVADFFADRIIQIKDGKIIKDYQNDKNAGYARMDDQNIYLQDMEKEQIAGEELSLFWYRDKEETVESVKLRLAYRDAKIYLENQSNYEIVLLDDNSEVHMLDKGSPKLEQKDTDQIDYHMEPIHAHKQEGLSKGEIRRIARENRRVLGKKQALLMVVLLIASIMLTISISEFFTRNYINKNEIITADNNILQVEMKADKNVGETEKNNGISELNERFFSQNMGQRVYSKRQASLSLVYDRVPQLLGLSTQFEGYSPVPIDVLHKKDLIYGRLPKTRDEVVVDQFLLERFRSQTALGSLFENDKEFLSQSLRSDISNDNLKIVGISRNHGPNIYMSETMLLSMSNSNCKFASLEELKAYNPEKYADLQLKDDQVLVVKGNEDKQDEEEVEEPANRVVYLNNRYSFRVAGQCQEDIQAEYILSNKACHKLILAHYDDSAGFRIYLKNPEKKQQILSFYKQAEKQYKNILKISLISPAQEDIRLYKESKKIDLGGKNIATIILILLSGIILYFTMNASIMARKADMIVYRLVGISPNSIMKAFMLEMSQILAVTVIPGVVITGLVIRFLSSMPSLGILMILPWWAMCALIVTIFAISLFISILPVKNIMDKPPVTLAD